MGNRLCRRADQEQLAVDQRADQGYLAVDHRAAMVAI